MAKMTDSELSSLKNRLFSVLGFGAISFTFSDQYENSLGEELVSYGVDPLEAKKFASCSEYLLWMVKKVEECRANPPQKAPPILEVPPAPKETTEEVAVEPVLTVETPVEEPSPAVAEEPVVAAEEPKVDPPKEEVTPKKSGGRPKKSDKPTES